MSTEALVDNVVVDVPDCPLITIRLAVAWAARDFCARSDAWLERDKHVVAMTHPKQGQVIVPSYGEAMRLTRLVIDGRDTVQGPEWHQPSPETVTFTREIESQLLIGDLAMRPHRDKMPPEEIIARWGEAFEHGARFRLLTMPQAWRDLEMAKYYQAQYSALISEAKASARLGHARGHQRVKARRFI